MACSVGRALLQFISLGSSQLPLPHGAHASSPGCSAVFSSAGGLLSWADWFGHPLLHLLALVVVLLLGCCAAARFWRWVSSGVWFPQSALWLLGVHTLLWHLLLDPSWDGSFITRMIVWLVDSGASHHMVPDRDLLHNFVPFATKPRIGTAKAGQYSYAIGYGDMHQLLQTSVGERKTVLRGVWCVPGLSSRLFSVRAHLKSAPGNSCVLEFVVSALHTSASLFRWLMIPHLGCSVSLAWLLLWGPVSSCVSCCGSPCLLLQVHLCCSVGCLASPPGSPSL